MRTKFPIEMYGAVVPQSWLDWLESWQRGLEAAGRADKTRRNYMIAVVQLGKFCVWRGLTQDVTQIGRKDIEEYLIFIKNTNHSMYTMQSYYEGCKQFYNWLVNEDEIAVHPMEKMQKPKVPDTDREVMSPEHVTAMLNACKGNEFLDRRDTAIMMVLIDTGLRLKELQGITIDNLDLRDKCIHVAPRTSKGGKVRDVPIGVKTTAALDRYLRKRSSHKHALLPNLWIGREGAVCEETISAMITKRAKEAGVPHTFPHLFRHTFAHMWLSDEGQEGDLRVIGGWNSDVMRRYGRGLQKDRARNAHKLHSPGDKF